MNTNVPIILVTLISIACSNTLLAGNGSNKAKKIKPEWYLRLSVATPSEDLKDEGNVLGQLQDSVDGQDSHDLIELNPAFDTYLTLVFPHDDWVQAGHYGSDFHNPNFRKADQWAFMVKSDDSYRDITLYWSDIRVIERLPKFATDPVVVAKKDWKLATDAPVNEKLIKLGQKLTKRMWLMGVSL